MKKLLTLSLVILCMTLIVPLGLNAEETTFTTTVPSATYTLKVPEDQEIPFGEVSHKITPITATDGSGFAENKNLQVTITYESFKCDDPEVTTEIPYSLRYSSSESGVFPSSIEANSGDSIIFLGKVDGTLEEYASFEATSGSKNPFAEEYRLVIQSADWGKALAGKYSSTMTFTAEVVVDSE